jgi:hypothetical protein
MIVPVSSHRLLIVAVVTCALAAAPAAEATSGGGHGSAAAAAKKKRCKIKKVRGKRKRVCTKAKKTTPAKPTTPAATTPAAPPATTPPATTAPTPNPPPPPPAAPQATRDDAAGQAKLAGGDLLLERATFGASGRTAEYTRLFFYANGVAHIYKIDWNDVSGESCSTTTKGTWVFKEGYRYAESGGGTIVKITTTANGQSGDDVLVFPDNDNAVYLYAGQQLVRFERNPNMRDSC